MYSQVLCFYALALLVALAVRSPAPVSSLEPLIFVAEEGRARARDDRSGDKGAAAAFGMSEFMVAMVRTSSVFLPFFSSLLYSRPTSLQKIRFTKCAIQSKRAEASLAPEMSTAERTKKRPRHFFQTPPFSFEREREGEKCIHLFRTKNRKASVLFGLFTSCMLCDQWSVLSTNVPRGVAFRLSSLQKEVLSLSLSQRARSRPRENEYREARVVSWYLFRVSLCPCQVAKIDRLKGEELDVSTEVNEVFGGRTRGFHLHWLLPLTVVFPESLHDDVMGYRLPEIAAKGSGRTGFGDEDDAHRASEDLEDGGGFEGDSVSPDATDIEATMPNNSHDDSGALVNRAR